jgi:hypothetical protein
MLVVLALPIGRAARSVEPRPLVAPVGTPLVLVRPLGRAKTAAGGGGARAPLLAPTPHPGGWTGLGLILPYVAYVCFNYFRRFICTLQLFHFDVAKVDQGMLHMLHMLQVLQMHIMLQVFVQNILSVSRHMLQSFFI